MDKVRKELHLKQGVVDFFIKESERQERSVKWLMEKCLELAAGGGLPKSGKPPIVVGGESKPVINTPETVQRELVRREKPDLAKKTHWGTQS